MCLRLPVLGIRCCVYQDSCDNCLLNSFETGCWFVVDDVVAVVSYAVVELVKISVCS